MANALPDLIDRLIDLASKVDGRMLDAGEMGPINVLDAKINGHCQILGLNQPSVEIKEGNHITGHGFTRTSAFFSRRLKTPDSFEYTKSGHTVMVTHAWLQAMRGLDTCDARELVVQTTEMRTKPACWNSI